MTPALFKALLLCAVLVSASPGCSFDSTGLPAGGDGPVAGVDSGKQVPDITPDRALVDAPPCTPKAAEACNGKDDDCDGKADVTTKLSKLPLCPVQSPYHPIPGYKPNYHCSRVKMDTPPKGWTSAIAWLSAIYTGDATGKEAAKVEVDWVRLYGKDDKGKVHTITGERKGKSGVAWMGHWPCTIWFKTDYHTGDEKLMTYAADVQVFDLTAAPKQIWHFGGERVPDSTSSTTPTSEIGPLPSNLKKVWMKARVRVTGKAMIRGGVDFWKTFAAQFSVPDGNNTEGASGPWQGPTSGWKIISAGNAE